MQNGKCPERSEHRFMEENRAIWLMFPTVLLEDYRRDVSGEGSIDNVLQKREKNIRTFSNSGIHSWEKI